MKVNFETERLIIRPLVPDDAEAAFRWCGDPNVNTYMILVIGDHQRFEGYTLLLCKEHATELSQLAPDFRTAFLRDMAMTAEAVERAFHPDKVNYELLGAEKGRHMHWHIFPRRNGDTPKPGPVWQVQDMNDDRYLPSGEKLEELKSSLRKELDLLCK